MDPRPSESAPARTLPPLHVAPMTREHAVDVCTWRYQPPYECYDMTDADPGWLVDPQSGFHALLAGDRLVGERLACDRCAYAEAEPDEDHFTMTGSYAPGLPPLHGRMAMSDFSAETLRCMRAGKPYVVADAFTDERVLPQQRDIYRRTGITAVVCVPLHKAGRFVAAMAVHQARPRVWTNAEIDLLTTVRTGDVVLVPHGWHGPAMAAPGYDLYYLNVMAGPGERAWRACDDPAHAWVRDAWAGQAVDPRLPFGRGGSGQ